MRKILHAADIHLDSPLKKLDRYDGAPAQRIRGASRRALENLTSLAIKQQVDLVVIAGDLYDGDWSDQNTGLAFVKEASKLIDAGIPILVIRGNHDAANRMTSSLPLPTNPDGSNVILDAERPESRCFDALGIAVHGQSFANRAETSNLAAAYPSPISGMFNLGLLHTGLEGASSHAHYAPCSPVQLTDLGYDYWALGHIHQRSDHAVDGGPPIVFSGNIQGRHIGETGPKGCCIIEVDDTNRCHYEFWPLDVLRWHECIIDASEFKFLDDAKDAFEQWVLETTGDAEDRLSIGRVYLRQVKPDSEIHRRQEQMLSDLKAIGIAIARESFWLEDLRVRLTDSTPADHDESSEGPIACLQQTVQTLREQEDIASIIRSELEDLRQKLPRELKDVSDDPTLRFDDADWRNALIESASAEILGRMEPNARSGETFESDSQGAST